MHPKQQLKKHIPSDGHKMRSLLFEEGNREWFDVSVVGEVSPPSSSVWQFTFPFPLKVEFDLLSISASCIHFSFKAHLIPRTSVWILGSLPLFDLSAALDFGWVTVLGCGYNWSWYSKNSWIREGRTPCYSDRLWICPLPFHITYIQ